MSVNQNRATNKPSFLKEPLPKGKIIDITIPLSQFTPVYPGDPNPSLKKVSSLEKAGFAVTSLSFGSHTGTHIDAQTHVFENGKSSEQIDLATLMGKALLLDFSSKHGAISAETLNTALEKIKRSALSNEISILLLKTKKANKVSETQGINAFSDSCWLGKEAATLLVKKGFKTVGVDAFSLDAPASKKLPIHKLLLSNFINIVECLDLRAVKEGLYYFLCLPLKIEACDGAPARALLIVEA